MQPKSWIASTAALAAALALAYHVHQQTKAAKRTLRSFQLHRVLSCSTGQLCLLGKDRANDNPEDDVIVIIQHIPFLNVMARHFLDNLELTQTQENDVYRDYLGHLVQGGRVKVTKITRASAKHIAKYSRQKYHLIRETSEMYHNITKPYILASPVSKHQWVLNILNHESEQEHVMFENPDATSGFMLLPDTKWPRPHVKEQLYCLAICHDKTLKSLRDLTSEHLPLLRNLRNQTLEYLAQAFDLKATDVRMIVHYQPSYYHFHVHFMALTYDTGIATGKAVLLDDILDHLDRDGGYYARANLSYLLGEQQHAELYQAFQSAGYL